MLLYIWLVVLIFGWLFCFFVYQVPPLVPRQHAFLCHHPSYCSCHQRKIALEKILFAIDYIRPQVVRYPLNLKQLQPKIQVRQSLRPHVTEPMKHLLKSLRLGICSIMKIKSQTDVYVVGIFTTK